MQVGPAQHTDHSNANPDAHQATDQGTNVRFGDNQVADSITCIWFLLGSAANWLLPDCNG